MNITQNMLDQNFLNWQKQQPKDRDKFVYESLFGDVHQKNIPPFSENVVDTSATNLLINKLIELECSPIHKEQLPRSILSVVSCGEVALPAMPYHKAVALIAYMVAVELNRIN